MTVATMNAESKPVCELTEEQLDRVSGGGTRSSTKDPFQRNRSRSNTVG
jgi:hypothetical protein